MSCRRLLISQPVSPSGCLRKLTKQGTGLWLLLPRWINLLKAFWKKLWRMTLGLDLAMFASGIGLATKLMRMPERKKLPCSILILCCPRLTSQSSEFLSWPRSLCFPEIVKKINDKLGMNIQELNKMPKTMSSKGEAVTTFMGILGSSKESLRRIIVRGEFNEYPDDFHMHCTARLAEMLDNFSSELNSAPESDQLLNFLEDEINILEEAKGIWLPNYLSPVAFLTLLQKKIKGISWIPLAFVDNVWNYIEGVVISVLMQRCESYHRLQLSTRRICQNLISRMRERSVNWVNEILEMEKSTDYTCNPEYLTEWNRLLAMRSDFITSVQIQEQKQTSQIEITGFGVVTVGDAVKKSLVVDQAFDLRMRIVTYWKIVIRRVVDSMALHIQLCVRNLVENELEKEMVNELMGSSHGGHAIEKVLEESPLLAAKREKLKGSIELLRDSKEVLATIMDRIASAQII
ncbi:Dynamin-related protein 4C [Linum grandiflorum]